MSKIRVHELAKQLKMTSKELMAVLSDLGVVVKSHTSSIDPETAKTVKDLLKEGKKVKKKAPPKKPVPRKAKPKAPKVVIEKISPKVPEVVEVVKPEVESITITTKGITVKDLADKLRVKVSDLIKELMKKGILATINQRIDIPIASEMAKTFGMELKVELKKEEIAEKIPELKKEELARLVPRPPIVTILGHVDHGKTRLLDAIRKTNVIATEAGGITQHIGAYQVTIGNKKVTFLDTPGHEAFTALRARGAKVTDLAVLVVAADDGVMPQTVEAIDHAKAARVPIIVAINKIDKPEANPDRVKQQLTELGLTPEEWGGKTVTVPISAKQLIGIENLLEMILLSAEMQELKANPGKAAAGIVIEARLDRAKGPVATVLIKEGTLRVGDAFSIGATYGKVRALMTDIGERVKLAPPAMPIEVLGASEVPQAGDILQVAPDEKTAKQRAEHKKKEKEIEKIAKGKLLTLESFSRHIKAGEIKDLNLIVKTDVQGSLEVLTQSLNSLSSKEVRINIVHSGVGAISESDVMLAKASQAIVVGFGVPFSVEVKAIAEAERVDTRLYKVIYNVTDDIKLAMEGMLEPIFEEVILGHAEVKALFKSSKVGIIAGCSVTDGKLQRNTGIRVLRAGEKIHEGKLDSIKRFKEDVKEVEAGFECGVVIAGYTAFKEGDILENFEMREKPRRKLS